MKLSKEQAERVHNVLTGQEFFDWYSMEFDNYVTGEPGAKSKEEILKDIVDIFSC